MAETYNTNLAAEFHVLSALHRLGADANLTLGNKKSVDIVVVRGAGDTITIDVKGLAGKTSFPVDNVKKGKADHFIVLVCFLGKIEDTSVLPEVYVVPSIELTSFMYTSPKGRKVIPLSRMRRPEGKKYKDAWPLVI
jgi:penicillin-binding protein-related factor A (putative recombinase)